MKIELQHLIEFVELYLYENFTFPWGIVFRRPFGPIFCVCESVNVVLSTNSAKISASGGGQFMTHSRENTKVNHF